MKKITWSIILSLLFACTEKDIAPLEESQPYQGHKITKVSSNSVSTYFFYDQITEKLIGFKAVGGINQGDTISVKFTYNQEYLVSAEMSYVDGADISCTRTYNFEYIGENLSKSAAKWWTCTPPMGGLFPSELILNYTYEPTGEITKSYTVISEKGIESINSIVTISAKTQGEFLINYNESFSNPLKTFKLPLLELLFFWHPVEPFTLYPSPASEYFLISEYLPSKIEHPITELGTMKPKTEYLYILNENDLLEECTKITFGYIEEYDYENEAFVTRYDTLEINRVIFEWD